MDNQTHKSEPNDTAAVKYSGPTPGPWHVSSTHLGAARDVGAANGANIALVSGPEENGADEFKANARLIAAAPDMLAALQAIVARNDSYAHTDSAFSADLKANAEWGAARAAIAKATGGA